LARGSTVYCACLQCTIVMCYELEVIATKNIVCGSVMFCENLTYNLSDAKFDLQADKKVFLWSTKSFMIYHLKYI
jgi:hypothetical protein